MNMFDQRHWEWADAKAGGVSIHIQSTDYGQFYRQNSTDTLLVRHFVSTTTDSTDKKLVR